MGANSFRKRVFQGPLTLGLHSTTFRSALPSATLPYPRRFFLRAKPRTSFFSLSSFPVGYDRRLLFARALTGFHLFGYPRRFYHRANRPLVFFTLFCSCRLGPTFAFRGCSLRFSPVRVPAQVSSPRKPRTCLSRFFLFLSVITDIRFWR